MNKFISVLSHLLCSGVGLARATFGMLERLEWNAVSVLCIRPSVLYSVART